MSRSLLNFLVDCVLLVIWAGLMFCSVVVRFVFPAGSEAIGWRLWGLSFDHWSSLQFNLVATLSLGVLVHLMLHWSWVCGFLATRLSGSKKAKVDDGLQTIYGVGALIVLLNLIGLAIAAATLTVQAPA